MQVSQPIVSLFQSGGGTFAPPLVGATRFTSENGGMTANRLPSTTRFRSENHNQGNSHWNWLPSYTWLRGRDLNPRPSGYEPDELPDCSTPLQLYRIKYMFGTRS